MELDTKFVALIIKKVLQKLGVVEPVARVGVLAMGQETGLARKYKIDIVKQ